MPGGRPTKYREEYDELVLDVVGEQGESVAQFAKRLKVARQTIYQWAEDQPSFSDALSRAQEWSEATWQDKIVEMMKSRDVNAPLVKLYLANRFGWSDKKEITGKDGAPLSQTVVILPAKQDD